jgi:hypothetical protein
MIDRRRLDAPAVVCLLALMIATDSEAQTAGQSTPLRSPRVGFQTVVVVSAAPIFVVPDGTREPLRVAKEGSTLRLIQQDGEWCNVEFQDPQYGRRTGYVQTKFVKVNARSTQLEPVDLSVPEARDTIQATAPPPQMTERAAAAKEPLTTPARFSKPVRPGISKARRVTGGILIGLGAYYFISALAAEDSYYLKEYQDAWVVFGIGTTTAGVIVLLTGRENSPSPALTFGPHRFVAMWKFSPKNP